MLSELSRIFEFVIQNLIHIWPYLLLTIPLAVFIRLTGRFSSIEKYLKKRPFTSILIATLLGALSPFCSCGVIPVIASLLLGGVPLAPVMSFWLASPSMDPEIFFLSVSMLGWQIALWRLGGTFFMSFAGGYVTHYLLKAGWIKGNLLRSTQPVTPAEWLQVFVKKLKAVTTYLFPVKSSMVLESNCCSVQCSCSEVSTVCCTTDISDSIIETNKDTKQISFRTKLFKESLDATMMVVKFMLLAYLLEALLIFYVPSNFIISLLGKSNPFAIFFAALMGIPVYTSNLTALPIIGGLLAKGMSGGTALAFLISGPTTTIPAMAAVWKLTTKKVFFIYILMTLISAVMAGYLFEIISGF